MRRLFELAEGEISAPVETEYGVHLIQAVKVVKAPAKSLAEMRSTLEDEIRQVKLSRCSRNSCRSCLIWRFPPSRWPDVANALGLTG